MPVWQNAHNIAVKVFHLTHGLPRSEDYGLTSQIRRASNGVAANIAEGFGRKTNKDKVHFYIMARGSAFETQNHLIFGTEVGYFDKSNTQVLVSNYTELIFELNKLISYLGKG
jgi:four helix bundle protein